MIPLVVWYESTRAYSLIAGISPVLIGTAIAAREGSCSWIIFLLSLAFSVVLQIATNWANDYFDFIKGADTLNRKAPFSVLQKELMPPRTLLYATLIALFLATLIALPLLIRIGVSYLPLLIVALACAIGYSGGKYALGYLGLGDLLVLGFYGPGATSLTVLAQNGSIPYNTWIASLIPGAYSCAILCINNIRDVAEDTLAQKRTLVVRWGVRLGIFEYWSWIFIANLAPLLLVLHGAPWTILLLWASLPVSIAHARALSHHEPPFNRILAQTAGILTIQTFIFLVHSS